MEFDCLRATEPPQGDSLLFTIWSPELHGAHLVDLRRMKDWVDLEAAQQFWAQDPWTGNPVP